MSRRCFRSASGSQHRQRSRRRLGTNSALSDDPVAGAPDVDAFVPKRQRCGLAADFRFDRITFKEPASTLLAPGAPRARVPRTGGRSGSAPTGPSGHQTRSTTPRTLAFTAKHARGPGRVDACSWAKAIVRRDADWVRPTRLEGRQLDREFRDVQPSKAVVGGGGHARLLVGERESWRTPIRSGAPGRAELCFGDGCLPETCKHKMLEFGEFQVRAKQAPDTCIVPIWKSHEASAGGRLGVAPADRCRPARRLGDSRRRRPTSLRSTVSSRAGASSNAAGLPDVLAEQHSSARASGTALFVMS